MATDATEDKEEDFAIARQLVCARTGAAPPDAERAGRRQRTTARALSFVFHVCLPLSKRSRRQEKSTTMVCPCLGSTWDEVVACLVVAKGGLVAY